MTNPRVAWPVVLAALASVAAAPATASAVSIGATDSAVVYTAGPGEANRVHIDLVSTPEGPRILALDYSDLFQAGGRPASVTVAEPCRLVRSSQASPQPGAGSAPSARAAHAVPDEIACPVRPSLSVTLGDRSDTLSVGPALATADFVDGGAGTDVLGTGAGADAIDGGEDRDLLSGGPGADRMAGGAGVDVVRYDEPERTTGVVASLAGGPGSGGPEDGPPGARDALSGVEDLGGTRFRDELTGDAGPNDLAGSLGDDALSGGGGADVLSGGLGRDEVTGGGGDDSVVGRDGQPDRVRCDGAGQSAGGSDVAVGDARDRIGDDCETVAIADIYAVDAPMEIAPRARLTAQGKARLRIRCAMRDACSGRVTVRDTRGRTLGRRRFRVAAERTRTVEVGLRRVRSRRVTVATATRDTARRVTVTTRRVRLGHRRRGVQVR